MKNIPILAVKYNLFFAYFNLFFIVFGRPESVPIHTALLILHTFILLTLGPIRKRIYLFYKLHRWGWTSVRFHGDTVSAKMDYGFGRTAWYVDRLYDHARGRASDARGWSE